MLQALKRNGTPIIPASLSKKTLTELRRLEKFYCPDCGREVMLKAGRQTIPHFAHFSKDEGICGPGGEGIYHELGKMLLYKWLCWQGISTELEAHIASIGRRADMLASFKQTQLVVEFQCARTDYTEIRQRMQAYKDAGFAQLWILGANRFKRIGTNKLKVDQYTQLFLQQYQKTSNLFLYYFCPQTMQFISFQNPYLTTNTIAYGSLACRHLKDMRLTDLFSIKETPIEKISADWVKEKRRFRLSAGRTAYGSEKDFRAWLYHHQLYIEQLPACIYLPNPYQYGMNVPTWVWQAKLCMEVLQPLPNGVSLRQSRCERHVAHLQKPKALLPLLAKPGNPVKAYLLQLTHLGYLEALTTGQFQKTKPIICCRNVEQALYEDALLMKHWKMTDL